MTASPNMQQALALAAGAAFSTVPNPMVGAVLVRDGEVVGEGRHEQAGGPHAEVVALRAAGDRARGATLYVTLEPCAHHGRTPPCADALIETGVARVVAAIADPQAGFARLRAAGVEVLVGDGAAEAEVLNARWLAARRAGRPFVGLKLAMTLDGKIATAAGESRWITGDSSRAEGHRLRAAYAAIAVGAGTVLADDPALTARDADGGLLARQPLRVVVDGRLRIPRSAQVLDPAQPAGALIATSAPGLAARGEELSPWARAFPPAPGAAGSHAAAGQAAVDPGAAIDLSALLAHLAAEGVDSLLVEGGGELAWSFAAAGLVDHVHAFVAPLLLGGREAPQAVSGAGFANLADALRLRFVRTRALGDDVLLEATAGVEER